MEEINKTKSERALKEEKLLQFWKENNIFQKSLEKKSPKGEFVFYEGPPTANAAPALHHLVSRVFKDALPRYKTMRGYHVPRKAGWDTHGLPVELQIEKKLGLKSKKEIETYGIERFNKEAKQSVFEYIEVWEKFTERIGYWVNFKDAYYTFDNSYIETLWSILDQVEKKGLLYKDYKVLPWCPRCGTALSSHELAQGYQDVKDLTVYAKFKIKGFPNAYFLAWTTTPWTLPGNVALAVGGDIDYVEAKVGEDIFVLAKEKLSLLTETYEIVAEHKGREMVGMEYEPLYTFIKDVNDRAYKVYEADFVNTEDGTGIVHTAVMYGQDDFELGTKVGLPKYHIVDETGHFKPEAEFLAGKFVRDEETAVEIIKDLAHRSLLFKKEKYEHSYPHCWRCKTPLIYYARDSWYIAMSKLRDELVKENEKIHWEPAHIKEGRFGEWLREIKDWAISRERYWGTPLPIWQNKDGSKRVIVDSIDTLKKYSKNSGNKFVFVRHGEAESNVEKVCASNINKEYHLTDKGRSEAKNTGVKIGKADAIYTSPYMRTMETAEIISESINYDKNKIKTDSRLGEFNFGEFDGRPFAEYLEYRKNNMISYDVRISGGESYIDARKRFGNFLEDIDSKHKNETIVVVTHGIGLESTAIIIDRKDLRPSKRPADMPLPSTGEMFGFNFVPLPHDENFEIDLHRPYIDEIVLEKDGEEYRRVKEVMDVWFDSGAMPFAQDPKNVRIPADFISEAIDQTRGWFYTLHAIGILMGKGHVYKNVICLGHILDKEGKKMSKSIGNIVNPWEMIDKYGVDTLRLWMYSVNQPGESKNFDERSVDELQKRVFNLLDNVYSFYELYRDREVEEGNGSSDNILDKWILTRLAQLTDDVTKNFDIYKLLEPVRSIREFIDELSTWYLRRSRERIKEGDKDAKRTLYFALKEISKLLAPLAPFYADNLYQNLRNDKDPISVHLDNWPENKKSLFSFFKSSDEKIITDMRETRRLVTLALEQRQKANIKVRQPLQKLEIKNQDLGGEYLEIIKDELNVKEVTVNKDLSEEVKLDVAMTPELEEEGRVRDIIRASQEIRKEKNLSPGQHYTLKADSGEFVLKGVDAKFLLKHKEEIERATNLKIEE